jgi:DNA processing protein
MKYFSTNIKKLTLGSPDYPAMLRQINSPPKQLFVAGPLAELLKLRRVAIVGSRSMTVYGRQVTEQLAGRLAEQGMVIVSGLALGVDGTAHRAALESGGQCIAVLPSPLDRITPATNRRLARQIIERGGALVSEYPPGMPPLRQHFIARNRLMSGLADAVLITEAGEKSGSLYTADFAVKQGREVLAVPGSIYNPISTGTNNLLKAGSAAVATSYMDVLHALNLVDHSTPAKQVRGRNAHEQVLLDLMLRGITQGEVLLEQSALSTSQFNQVLTMLEIGGKIRPLGANHWAIF